MPIDPRGFRPCQGTLPPKARFAGCLHSGSNQIVIGGSCHYKPARSYGSDNDNGRAAPIERAQRRRMHSVMVELRCNPTLCTRDRDLNRSLAKCPSLNAFAS